METMNNATTATTSSCAVLASDFSDRTTDVLRHRWTPGKMRHLVAALDGAPVAVTVDRMSGAAMVGVKLIGLQAIRMSTRFGVVIESTYEDENGELKQQRTNYPLDQLGEAIIPLDERGQRGAKWEALDRQRKEHRLAISRAQHEHGEVEGRAWGRWRAESMLHDVYVTYEPHTGNEAFADKWGMPWHGKYAVGVLLADEANAA